MTRRRAAIAAVLAVLAVAAAALVVRSAAPAILAPAALVHAHAHNDYEHARPLLEALDHGFCSIEADVWLVGGRLLVAHDADKVREDRTLESLYLGPLRERVRANGGRLYRNGPECTLLVDVKSDAVATYGVLAGLLARYDDVLTTFRGGKADRGAILAIVSGNTAPALMAAEPTRYAAMDGRFADLRSDVPADLVPWISMDWKATFQWQGSGPMPENEVRLLRQLVAGAHEHDRKLRFWNTPDSASFWEVLWDAKVDLIGADDLGALETFLRAKASAPFIRAP